MSAPVRETVFNTFQRLMLGRPSEIAWEEPPVWSVLSRSAGPEDGLAWKTREVEDRRKDTRHLPGGRRALDRWRDGVIAEPPRDRRKEPRYIPVCRRAYLGWWAGETFQSVAARFENLSRGGAALLVEYFPGEPKPVWLCPIGPDRSDWHPAKVVSVTASGGAGRLVRIELTQGLPYDVFKELVWGFPGQAASTTP